MSTPSKHHYVPECYLKPFSDSKKIYALDKKYNHIFCTSIGAICYKLDYFKIERQETLVMNNVKDPYWIEKDAFKRHENAYGKLLSLVLSQQHSKAELDIDNINLFFDFLISLKRRNPTTKALFQSQFKKRIVTKKFQDDIKMMINLSLLVDKEGTEKFMKTNYMGNLENDNELGDRYKSLFIKESNAAKLIIQSMMQNRFFIAYSESGAEFITSDNPGFCITDNLLRNFGGFDAEYHCIFPLTAKHCLIISSSQPDANVNRKKIDFLRFDETAIMQVNRYTTEIANERVFSKSRMTLEKIKSNTLSDNNRAGL